MSDMVERVARAMHEAVYEQSIHDWQNSNDYIRGYLRKQARAAIAAMREPTETMINRKDADGRAMATDIWQSMIDEALK